MFPIRRTFGSGYIKTLKELPLFEEEPVVISLIQIVFLDHGLYISKYGYLIFLGIVIMNLKNRHDTQQGFVRFIIPAQQQSTALVSHTSSPDSTQSSSIYLPPSWGGRGGGNLQIFVFRFLKIFFSLDSSFFTILCVGGGWGAGQPSKFAYNQS